MGMMSAADDRALLDAVPGHISITQMLKASPVQEGGERFVYLEASNESLDQQGEVVLAKALAESADYFLRFGNLDIDHYTQIGARTGIPGYELYEIGRPVEVKASGGSTFVKGQIYSGSGPAAEKANAFWSSLTELNPPARWYPSVGGAVVSKSVQRDPVTGERRAVIEKVRWTNIGFSKTPVNANLATVRTVPFGALAKSWTGAGFALGKALEAGYGTAPEQVSEAGALRLQSLGGGVLDYWDFRDWLAERIRRREVAGGKPAEWVEAATSAGLPRDRAARYVERFLHDLKVALKKGK